MGEGTCAVCGAAEANGLSRVVIEGRCLELCRSHAASVVAAMPETFEELRALFIDGSERRSPLDRRAAEDRRVFPPRFEGRRMGTGRRAADPQE